MQRERSTARSIAITGSNGKTSVKTLLLSILQRAGAARYANPGNRNNEIGLPLAVLDAPDDAQFAIYEMGAGKPGDIAYLTAIARPDVALVNNIAPAHLERMGSLLGVAETKGAIYDALPADGVAVINADDAFAPFFAERAHGRRLIRFGLDASADVTARDIAADADGSRFVLVTPQGEAAIALAMPGRHNVRNALAAASLALGAGVGAGRDRAPGSTPRSRSPAAWSRIASRNGAVLIDDSYNANPGSLHAAIDTLAADRQRRRRSLAGARRHARTRRRRRGAARRSRAPREDRRHRAAVHAGPAERARRAAPSATAPAISNRTRALADALRATHAGARGRARAGQGLARQRDGSRSSPRCCAHRGGNAACCLNSPAGWSSCRACSGCSATSPSAASSAR